jgi:hypothetical protein
MSVCPTSIVRLLALVGALAVSAGAGSVFVNNQTGDDARGGASAEQAVRSLQRAVLLCQAGDTLQLANTGEPYYESLALGSKGGAPTAPIIVAGHGATLSGLRPIPPEAWEPKTDGLIFHATRLRQQVPAARPFLVRQGTMVPRRRKPEDVGVEESCWNDDGVYFRMAPGKTVADYQLGGTMLLSGVALAGGSYIEVRDLVCENFANDGFNVHGSCQGLVFRNIVSRWNGDDGFSVHEDVGAVVLGGHFHHNDYGIQDINISRSSFYGVLAEENRRAGADFSGGFHVLVDSVFRHNTGPQISLRNDGTRHMREPDNAVAEGMFVLKNTLTLGGTYGLHVPIGRADVSNCSFVGAEEGVRIGAKATVEMIGCAVYGCKTRELVCQSETSRLAANLYSPGRMQWGAKAFAPDEFGAYQKLSGQDGQSAVAGAPVVVAEGAFRLAEPRLVLAKRQVLPGVLRDPAFPWGEPVTNPVAGVKSAAADGLSFDFERTNPWCRVYPVPEKTKGGKAVVGKADLSTEQSHSGTHSVKLDVTFPPGKPGPWLVKLFSVKFPMAKPVTEMRFALYGDGSGVRYQPRVRDGKGEGLYGPAGKLDWQGWREIVWDLQKTPPVQFLGGDGNHLQDGPTFELVLEVTPTVSAEGGHFVLYLDDLQARFAP